MKLPKGYRGRVLIVNDNYFQSGYMFCFGDTYQAALALYQNRIHAEDYDDAIGQGTVARFHVHGGRKSGLVWFKDSKPSAGTIAHECFHAISYMLEMSGIKLSFKSDEAYAYGMEFLCDCVHKFLKSRDKIKEIL